MKDLVVMSMQSVRKKLNAEARNYCFEIFGYDFIIDEAFKVWLIEINTNPCLEESSKLLRTILPRMVDDALKLTVDQIFPRKRKTDFIEPTIYKVSGYSDSENMWEYLHQIGIVKNPDNYKATASTLSRLQQTNISLQTPSKPESIHKAEPKESEGKEECENILLKQVSN